MSASAPSRPTAPPDARERLAIAALALAAFALNLNTSVLGALLPFVPPEFAANGPLLLAAAGFGSAFGALLVIPLARRHGRRAVLLGGLLVFCAASALHLLASGWWPFVLLRAISGLAVGVAYAAASALVADVAPYVRRGAAMGRFNAGLFLAIPIGMPLAVALARTGSWTAIFAVQAGVGGLGWALARRTLPADGEREAAVPARPVLARPAVLAGLLATALHVGSFFVTVQLAAQWLDQNRLVPRGDQMLLWVGLGLLSVAGSALFGRLADAIGKRNFVLATSAVLVGCFLYIARGPEPAVLLAVGCLLALTAAARTGPLQALVSGQVNREQLNVLMGWRGFVMQAGVGGFALAAAPLAADLGFRGVLFLAAACQAASYVVIRLWVREGS